MLQSVGSQRIGHDLVTEQQQTQALDFRVDFLSLVPVS